MVAKGEWSDYEKGKKKEYGEFVRKAKGVCLWKRATMASQSE
jgi:hypothetical protein